MARRLARRALLAAFPAAALVGCASLSTDVTGALSNGRAAEFYGIAKGMGLVVLGAAELLDPALTPVVSGIQAIITAADPLVAPAATDPKAAAQLTAQSHALILAAAPLITVVSNTGPRTP